MKNPLLAYLIVLGCFCIFIHTTSAQIIENSLEILSENPSFNTTDTGCKQWEGPCNTVNNIWRNAQVGIGGFSMMPDYMLRVVALNGYQAGIFAQGPVGIHAKSTPQSSLWPKPLAGFFEGDVDIVGWLNISNGTGYAATMTGNLLIAGDGDINGTLEVDVLHAIENIYSKEVHVKFPPFPDYVFEKDYPLMPISELEAFVQENKRLPNMPSAAEVAENGAGLGDMQVRLTEKIEELTLYLLEMNKRLDALEAENGRLMNQLQERQD